MQHRYPLVSVIIPTHNSENFVSRCIESVINQSEKAIEVIAVDDQSTDETKEILQGYAGKLQNFRYFETAEWLMAGGARNVGIEHSNGRYICFVDSDDWIDSNFLYHMISSIESSKADISICGVKREYANAKNSVVRYKYSCANSISGSFALDLMSRIVDQDIAISSIPPNNIFRSEFIHNADLRFPEKSVNEDDVFMFKAFMNADFVSITEETYYHLFQRKDSVSRSFSKRNITDLMDAFKEIREYLELNNLFATYRLHFYAFFEKCFQYVLETMRISEQDEQVLNGYLKYAYEISSRAISFHEFIEYCGSQRIESFFKS